MPVALKLGDEATGQNFRNPNGRCLELMRNITEIQVGGQFHVLFARGQGKCVVRKGFFLISSGR